MTTTARMGTPGVSGQVDAVDVGETGLQRPDSADVEKWWADLAEWYRVRLPRRNAAPTRRNQTRFLHQLGLTWGTAVFLNEKPGEFFQVNHGWTTHMWAGVVLEQMAASGER